jgi:hypothetical protein
VAGDRRLAGRFSGASFLLTRRVVEQLRVLRAARDEPAEQLDDIPASGVDRLDDRCANVRRVEA